MALADRARRLGASAVQLDLEIAVQPGLRPRLSAAGDLLAIETETQTYMGNLMYEVVAQPDARH